MRPRCVFCRSRAPGKLLRCLHKICFECLQSNVQPDGRIRCANCRRLTPCPPPARSHNHSLVDDSMFDNENSEQIETKNTSDNSAPSRITMNKVGSVASDFKHVENDECCAKQVKQNRRTHFCPVHSKRELLHYCRECREVLCEPCKLKSNHASHIDQVPDIHAGTDAAALKRRLYDMIKPHGRPDEVDKHFDYADNLLRAADWELQSTASHNENNDT